MVLGRFRFVLMLSRYGRVLMRETLRLGMVWFRVKFEPGKESEKERNTTKKTEILVSTGSGVSGTSPGWKTFGAKATVDVECAVCHLV